MRDRNRTSSLAKRPRWLAVGLAAAGVSFLAGCAKLKTDESALNPAGPQADRIHSLWHLFYIVCVVVYVLVMLTLLIAMIRRRSGNAAEGSDSVILPEPVKEKRLWTVVSACIGITTITLFVLLFSDFATGRSMYDLSHSPNPLRIKVIGHQWWWEVIYIDWPEQFGERGAYNQVTTANEIHIPAGGDQPVTVEFQLDSADVIHSFWVPNLHGKKDLIPGHATMTWLRADQPGTYWGECAEYCGYQHAQMRLLVVAEPPEKFHAWLEAQRKPAEDPKDPQAIRGKQVFTQGACLMCHSIQGTEARGRVGPDLTHLKSRQIIGAGAAQNVPGHLAGWVSNAQSIKPGVKMPPVNLSPQDLRALLEYLETLK